MNNKIKIGALVCDADPYKAPEVHRGFGTVLKIIDNRHVIVHWTSSNFKEFIKIENLEVINEDRR